MISAALRGALRTMAIAALVGLSSCLASVANANESIIAAALERIQTTSALTGSLHRSAASFSMFIASASGVNFQQVRWLTTVPPDRIEVNTATALLQLFRNNTPVFTTRVVVGGKGRRTPEFQASIDSVLFNPAWYVPHSIATAEILPKLRTDPGYLKRHNMIIRNGSVVQLPGPNNSLGQLKFDMPNPYDVYLHDTPLKNLFNLNDRRQSHGCVRVQNPRSLAALLLREPMDEIDSAIALGYTHRKFLPSPMPIFIFYGPNSARSGAARREGSPGLSHLQIALRRSASVTGQGLLPAAVNFAADLNTGYWSLAGQTSAMQRARWSV